MMRKLLPLAFLSLVACSDTQTMINHPPEAIANSSASSTDASESSAAPASVAPKSAAASVMIDVPFTTQSPYAVWDALHEEACEEAALLMVQRFWIGKDLDLQTAEDELQRMVAWQTENGFAYDVTMSEMLQIARAYYGLDGYIDTDVTEAHMKELLSKGYPLIVPTAGRELGNPYFSGAGPWYHVVTVVGYDSKNFLVHDPGTKRGEAYKYPLKPFIETIHDWTGVKEEIDQGAKSFVVITK